MKSVVVAAGSSGGHIFPAIGFAESLKEINSGLEISFFTGRKPIEEKLLKKMTSQAFFKTSLHHPRGTLSFLSPTFIVSFVRSFFEARKRLCSLKPALVIGFGGYSTVPVLLAARSLGVRTGLHEQNRKFGLANRFLKHVVKHVFTAFENTSPPAPKAMTTGMPIRRSLKRIERGEALHRFGLEPSKKTLFVMGGSQGSQRINGVLCDLLHSFGERLKENWQFLHLAGEKQAEEVLEAYKKAGVLAKVFPFYEEVGCLYSSADLVLCRAGATTLHEIAFFKKPSILIPHSSADGHQEDNALFLERKGAALLVWEREVTPELLYERLCELASNADKMEALGTRCASSLYTDGSRVMAKECLEILDGI